MPPSSIWRVAASRIKSPFVVAGGATSEVGEPNENMHSMTQTCTLFHIHHDWRVTHVPDVSQVYITSSQLL